MSSPPAHAERIEKGGVLLEAAGFAKFFEHWLAEQDRLLQLLRAAASSSDEESSGNNHGKESPRTHRLRSLVDQVLSHYQSYYCAKASSARKAASPMFNAPWRSSSEKMFLWVGGWRPSMAVQLLYSESGLQLEDRLEDVLRGVTVGNLADLSADQVTRVDQVHRWVIERESEITEAEAKVQETIVGADVVRLSHTVTDQMQSHQREEAAQEECSRRMEAAMQPRKEGMAEALERADALRLETLKAVVGILKPLLAVHFLIAAAEVHLRIHEWGKTTDGDGRDRD